MNAEPLFCLANRAPGGRPIRRRIIVFVDSRFRTADEPSRCLLSQNADLFGCATRDWNDVTGGILKRNPQSSRLSAALFNLGTGPTFVVRAFTLDSVLCEIELPDCISLRAVGQIEEERTQRESPAQFRRQARDGVASRNPKTPALRYRIHDLQSRSQAFARCADQRILHGGEIESNGRNTRSIARSLTDRRLGRTWRTQKDGALCFVVLHPRKQRSGHLRFHAGHISARSRECLFDLVDEHDNAWRIVAVQNCLQETFDLRFTLHLMSVNVYDRF